MVQLITCINSITLIAIPVVLDIVSALWRMLLLASQAFLLPILIQFVHVFNPKFLFHPLHLNRITHYLLHLLLCKLFFLYLEPVESFIVRFKVHEFISNSTALSLFKGSLHIMLPFVVPLNVINSANVVLEYIVAFILWLSHNLVCWFVCWCFFSCLHFV